MTAAQGSKTAGSLRRGRRRLFAGLLLVAILTTIGGAVYLVRFRDTGPEPPTATEESEPAVAAAVRVARQRVLKEPRSPDAWGDLGEVFLANDLAEQSQVCFAQAERLDPRNPRWPYFQVGPILNRGDREAALPYLQRAAELAESEEATNPAPRLFLAETLLALGRRDEAEQHFRRVRVRRPDDARASYGLGLLASDREAWEASREHLLRCLESPEARQKACLQLATLSQRLGDQKAADKFRKQAAHLPPDLGWDDPYETESLRWAVTKKSLKRLVQQLKTQGRSDEALTVLRQMTEDYPDDDYAFVALGMQLGEMRDYEGAEQALRQAQRLAPDKLQVHYSLSLALVSRGEQLERRGDTGIARALFEEAAEEARRALAISPDHGFSHLALGLALKHLGDRARVVTVLREAVRCNPESARIHFYLGEALAEDGQVKEARYYLEQAIEFGTPEEPWRQTAITHLATLKKDGEKRDE